MNPRSIYWHNCALAISIPYQSPFGLCYGIMLDLVIFHHHYHHHYHHHHRHHPCDEHDLFIYGEHWPRQALWKENKTVSVRMISWQRNVFHIVGPMAAKSTGDGPFVRNYDSDLTLYVLIFFRGNIKIYLHLMSYLHTNKTHVVEIPPRVRPAYSTQSISWLLMSWRRKEPGHQQPWFWPSKTGLTRSPHVKGWLRCLDHPRCDDTI